MIKLSLTAVPFMLLAFCCGAPNDDKSGKTDDPKVVECNCPLWICEDFPGGNSLWYCEKYDAECGIIDITFLELADDRDPAGCGDCQNCEPAKKAPAPTRKPLDSIKLDPKIEDFLPSPGSKGIRVLGTSIVDFPLSKNSTTTLRAKIFILEGNPQKASGTLVESEYRIFTVGYEMQRIDDVEPDFAISKSKFNRYVKPLADIKCHYDLNIGGKTVRVFTRDVRS